MSVLVGGCFDPLHPGHLAYFDAAQAWGPLCCAVATDAHIRAVKHRPPLLPQAARMELIEQLSVEVVAQDARGEAGVIDDLRPTAYIKGKDWEGRIPDAERAACERLGIPMVFVDTQQDSSGDRLRAYQRELDETAVARFEAIVAQQQPTSKPWAPVTPYDYESRKAIEGPHPQLIKDVFAPTMVIDAGCGIDGVLVRLLTALDVEVLGFDPKLPKRAINPRLMQGDLTHPRVVDDGVRPFADLVICREVLEHLTVLQLVKAVRNLVKLSSHYVYVTTRFHPDPASLLDLADHDDLDPTHITLLNKSLLRALFVLEGCKSRPDLEALMDWQHKGRCLVFEVA